jgi:diguanylate cyclase (GGDEF)-like protein
MTDLGNHNPPRIIVIDDNESIHEDLKKALRSNTDASGLEELEVALFGGTTGGVGRTEYEIDSALQGLQGVEMVQAARDTGRSYRLAFVDMRMPPGIDGLETIELLWQKDPDIQIVVCTAYTDYSWDEMIERLGLTDRLLIIKKPFDQAEVCQAAAAMCEKWHLMHQARSRVDDLQNAVESRTMDLEQSQEQLAVVQAERQEMELQLRHDALHDPLTSLANRTLLTERLEHMIQRSRHDGNCVFATLFLDIDDFKIVNDTMGHNTGDEVLKTVAQRITRCVRDLDTVARAGEDTTARLGGDEFVILLEGLSSPADAVAIADRIRSRIRTPIDVMGTQLTISTSIGIAVSTGDYTRADEILCDADTAMYRAKESGKDRYALFNRDMHEHAIARLHLENDLHRAIDDQRLSVLYQPIIRLDDGGLVGFEALLRWDRPNHGVMTVDRFPGVAEERGMIVGLGQWILNRACEQLRDWSDRFPQSNVSINVNLTRHQISEPSFIRQIEEVINQNEIDGARLNLELTEDGIMQNLPAMSATMHRLYALGVGLHMDEFSAGYASLSFLPQLPLSTIKIDRNCLNKISSNRDYTAIISGIMNMAHNLHMQVAAVGIETAEETSTLRNLGCDLVQGRYFADPMSAQEAETYIRADKLTVRRSA